MDQLCGGIQKAEGQAELIKRTEVEVELIRRMKEVQNERLPELVDGDEDWRSELPVDVSRETSVSAAKPIGGAYAMFADKPNGYAELNGKKDVETARSVAHTANRWKQKNGGLVEVSDNEEEEDQQDEFMGKMQKLLQAKRQQENKEKLEDDNGVLSTVPFVVVQWLKKRGYKVPTELSKRQRAELEECFSMIDADGSGAIDVEEMQEAFNFLGMNMSIKAVEKLFDEVDEDGSGEIEFEEFVEVMTMVEVDAADKPEGEEPAEGAEKESKPLPFPLLALAYRRRKLMEGTFQGTAAERDKVVKSQLAKNEAAKQDKMVEMKNEYNKIKEKEARKKQRRDRMFEGNAPMTKVYNKGDEERMGHRTLEEANTRRRQICRKRAARATRSHVSEDLMFDLSKSLSLSKTNAYVYAYPGRHDPLGLPPNFSESFRKDSKDSKDSKAETSLMSTARILGGIGTPRSSGDPPIMADIRASVPVIDRNNSKLKPPSKGNAAGRSLPNPLLTPRDRNPVLQPLSINTPQDSVVNKTEMKLQTSTELGLLPGEADLYTPSPLHSFASGQMISGRKGVAPLSNHNRASGGDSDRSVFQNHMKEMVMFRPMTERPMPPEGRYSNSETPRRRVLSDRYHYRGTGVHEGGGGGSNQEGMPNRMLGDIKLRPGVFSALKHSATEQNSAMMEPNCPDKLTLPKISRSLGPSRANDRSPTEIPNPHPPRNPQPPIWKSKKASNDSPPGKRHRGLVLSAGVHRGSPCPLLGETSMASMRKVSLDAAIPRREISYPG
mmetsp:Transcript_10154/g.17456  ORF Transcript_10154/g.17456 Transcript_10154/m.17456 type:complete len:779 (+) Transcript_10154:151-2487(+)